MAASRAVSRVYVVGMDALILPLVKRFASEGAMPNAARLLAEGGALLRFAGVVAEGGGELREVGERSVDPPAGRSPESWKRYSVRAALLGLPMRPRRFRLSHIPWLWTAIVCHPAR